MKLCNLLKKYCLISFIACSAGILAGCDDDPAPAQQAKPAQTADNKAVQEVAAKQPKFEPAPKVDSATIFANPQEYLKTLVVEGDIALDILVANQMDRDYHYEICIGDTCQKMVRDSSSGLFKYTCDKLNTRSPCSSVYNIKVCNDFEKVCNSKIIDFAGRLKAKKVKVGYEHACAIRLDNSVKCWGNTRGFSNPEGTQTADGTLAADIILSKSQDVTCVIDPNHNFKCYGVDAKRFKPIESLVRDASVSINSICYVTLDGKVYCIDAQDEENAYIAYTNVSGGNVNDLSDIKKIESEEFYTVALDFKGKLHFYGFNLDNSRFKEMRNVLKKIEDITDVKDFSVGNDAVCVIAGENNSVSCYGPKKSFDYTDIDIIGVNDAKSISVGAQSACVSYVAQDRSTRGMCGGLPFYYEGVPAQIDVVGISQGNNQVCIIRGNNDVECYGNDYHRNGVNFVPDYPTVFYENNGIVKVDLPKEDNPKLDGNTACRINYKRHEIICRIQKLDFLPKDLLLKPKFEVNSLDGQVFVNGERFINGSSTISLNPEQKITVLSSNGKPVEYKFKLLQTMKVVKKYDLNKTWDDAEHPISDYSCVWSFSDGSIDEGTCEKPVVHTFETDFAENKNDLKAKVDAYRKDVADGGFDIHHYQPKAVE